MRKATTKDELFLIKLHQFALLEGNDEAAIDRFVIGRAIGQNDKGISTIVDLCAKANFIKKGENNRVYLTPQGLKFVHDYSN
jgi:predicted transcriptional regulator